jgi:hypothetical protein
LFIKTNKFTLNAGNLYLTSNPTDNKHTYFKFKDKAIFNDDGIYINGNGTFSGVVTAEEGKIAGWTIKSDWFGTDKEYNGSKYGAGFYAGGAGTSNTCLAIGHMPDGVANTWGKAAFRVTGDGILYATGAKIDGDASFTGTINATLGNFSDSITIGGSTITGGSLRQLYSYATTGSGTTINYIDAIGGSIGGFKIGNGTGFSNDHFALGTDGWISIFPQSSTGGGVYYFNTSTRISVTGGIALSTNSNTGIAAHEKNLDLKACSGAAVYLGSMQNADGSGETCSITLSNGIITVRGTNASGSTDISDRNKKNSISTLEDGYDILFNNLLPIKYKYNDGTSNRYHTGFIAQDIKEALDKANLTTQDFAGLTIQNPETEDELWGLRYSEFVSLNTWQIQKAKTRIAELENKVSELEALIK